MRRQGRPPRRPGQRPLLPQAAASTRRLRRVWYLGSKATRFPFNEVGRENSLKRRLNRPLWRVREPRASETTGLSDQARIRERRSGAVPGTTWGQALVVVDGLVLPRCTSAPVCIWPAQRSRRRSLGNPPVVPSFLPDVESPVPDRSSSPRDRCPVERAPPRRRRWRRGSQP